jgi:hypothetical protein
MDWQTGCYVPVHDLAAHKPEAPAKDAPFLRWRLRLVGCQFTHDHSARSTSARERLLHSTAS